MTASPSPIPGSSLTPTPTGGIQAVLVEAFTDRACQGNGAAVVLLEQPLADRVLQGLARSLNQSETAFLLEREGTWSLRWFTPTCEVPLCGHATLAAVLALGHWGRIAEGQDLLFHTRSGALQARLEAASGVIAQVVLPSSGLVEAEAPADLVAFVGERLQCRVLGHWHCPLGYTVVLLPGEAALASADLSPGGLPPASRHGLVLMQPLTIPGGPRVLGQRCDYQMRFLAPGLGIDEDPVTGSAHALVAPWWLNQLGSERVAGWQCSRSPGGMLCEAASSGMIRLIGSGHLLWDGTLHLDSDGAPGPNSVASGWDGLSA